MTRKSHALNKLPLLGSNQDSPDPESVGFSGPVGKNGEKSGDFGMFRGIIPTEIHTVCHRRCEAIRRVVRVARKGAGRMTARHGWFPHVGPRLGGVLSDPVHTTDVRGHS